MRPIFNESFTEKRFVSPVNSAQDPLEKHETLFPKKIKIEWNADVVSKRIHSTKIISKLLSKEINLLGIQGEKQVVNSRILIMQTMNTVFQIFDDFMCFIPACDI